MMKLIRFFLYVRKSQARGDRQVLSIPAQIKEMTAYAEKLGIQIVAVFQEERTAKAPGRPVFNEMMDRIEKGEAEGILVWKIPRLSRNPVDDGRISWMLQRSIIRKIQTIERSYSPEDNVLFMRMEQGMANQYIRDLSVNVKRGMRTAAENGWLPASILPLGYVRNLDKKHPTKILKNMEQFPLVRELWKAYATGVYSLAEIKKLADSLGLKNQRGNPVTLSTFNLMFNNPFYCGYYYWKNSEGEKIRIEGKHEPMISEAEYLIVQDVMRRRGRKTRSNSYDFFYKSFMHCGECQGNITAERKHQVICSTCKHKSSIRRKQRCGNCGLHVEDMIKPSIIDITYYRCTKRKNPHCRQKAITETVVEQKVIEMLSKIEVKNTFYEWAKKRIDTFQLEEGNQLKLSTLKSKRSILKEKVNNLLELRVSGEISKDEYLELKCKFNGEQEHVHSEIVRIESQNEVLKSKSLKYLELARNCVSRFKSGSKMEKKKILSILCSNLIVLDKSLYFSTEKSLETILSINQA